MRGEHPHCPCCPHCDGAITFIHSARLHNPWAFRCPHCGELLETGWGIKLVALLAIPFGFLLGGFALYQHATGRWDQFQVNIYFLVTILVLLLLAWIAWPRTRFSERRHAASKVRHPADTASV